MLRIMSGVLHPQSGPGLARQSAVAGARTVLARQMAVVPQGGTIEFPFSVMEVVLMGRAPHLGGSPSKATRTYKWPKQRCAAPAHWTSPAAAFTS